MDIDVRQVLAAAAGRRQARRWQPVDARKAVAAALLEGREPQPVHNNWSGPEIVPAADLPGWLDDRLCERTWPPDAATAVLFAIAEAARDGRDAAVAAVRGARKLKPREQLVVYGTLMGWRGRTFAPAEGMLSAVIREWRKLKLATSPEEGR
jgi:hypothetical protein